MTSEENFTEIVKRLRKNHRDGKIRSIEARIKQLKAIHSMLEEHDSRIYEALQKDLHKNKVEANLGEILQLRIEIGNAIKNLKKWMKPESVKGDLINKLATCQINNDPLGVVLIIGAWNFPFGLVIAPLVGAISAGNCAVLKPSEVSENAAQLLVELVPKYLDKDVVAIVHGGVPETTSLLKERFDHIFYTGSPNVGKIIMRAASEHLTPVTLELGGKCPGIVDNTCNFDVVGQRIAWGRFINCGQACLCIDYAICIGKDVQEKLIESVKKAAVKFYGENPKESESYGRIVNKRHFHYHVDHISPVFKALEYVKFHRKRMLSKRISNMINKDKVVFGGDTDEDELYISPTIMSNVTGDDKVMEEEVFGPLLPVLTVESYDEAIDFINDREKPLGLYVFTTNYPMSDHVAEMTSSGGIVVNDVLAHYAVPTLPFGGVGHSGMGSYHGKYSFDTFTHKKAYLSKNQALETANSVRYPPYDENCASYRWAEWALKPWVKK